MPSFSASSLAKLNTCHPDLRRVFLEVVKHRDCTVIEGARTIETQRDYVARGVSKTLNSMHIPRDGFSHAVDIVPYPIIWPEHRPNGYTFNDVLDWSRFYRFAGFVERVAQELGIRLRYGGDWDGDMDLKDHDFYDLPHWELMP